MPAVPRTPSSCAPRKSPWGKFGTREGSSSGLCGAAAVGSGRRSVGRLRSQRSAFWQGATMALLNTRVRAIPIHAADCIPSQSMTRPCNPNPCTMPAAHLRPIPTPRQDPTLRLDAAHDAPAHGHPTTSHRIPCQDPAQCQTCPSLPTPLGSMQSHPVPSPPTQSHPPMQSHPTRLSDGRPVSSRGRHQRGDDEDDRAVELGVRTVGAGRGDR